MQVQNIRGLIDSPAQYFMDSSWKEKTVQILCAGSILLLAYYVARRCLKTEKPSSQDLPRLNDRVTSETEIPGLSNLSAKIDKMPFQNGAVLDNEIVKEPVKQELSSISPQANQSLSDLPAEIFELHIFHFLNAEELDKIAPVCQLWKALASSEQLSYQIPYPPWLKELKWKKEDLEKYGLDITGAAKVNRRALTKALKPLSRRVENNMGITIMVHPKNLTLNIDLQFAKDNSVPISPHWYDQITIQYGDIPAETTRVLFFTNSILTATRNHTPDQHEADVTNIGKECGVAIRMHQVRDFMAFLALTYLNSPEDARIRLYSLAFTRLLEKVDVRSLYGGFAPSGLRAFHRRSLFAYDGIGVGASGSSEDIGTGNIGA